MKKLRVLIIRNAYQQDTGGAEQYALNQAVALKNIGHSPILVTNHKSIRNRAKAYKIKSIKSHWNESQEWSRYYYIRYILTSFWYCCLILRHRINIVHPQSRDDFVFATNAGWIMHRKVVWTDHADLKYIMDRVNHPHPRMQRWILNVASKTRKIICVSNSERLLILRSAPELKDKLKVIHNGVFIPNNVKPVPKNGFVIGTNSRLVDNKGINELLDAFALFNKKVNSSELWLVGGYSGNKIKFENRASALGIANNVKFIGYIPNPNDFVASMDIFVHASYHEAFSLAIIEACMLGKTIIATSVGGTPEIINPINGILVPPKDSDALYREMIRLYDDKKLMKNLGANAQKLALEKFDFQKIVKEQIVPIYVSQL